MRSEMKIKILLFLFVTAFCTFCSAASFITVSKTSTAPVIDGKINDNEWKNAVEITGFTRFSDGKYKPSDTVLLMMYDNDNIYIGCKSSWTGNQMYKKLSAKDNGKMFFNDTVDIRFIVNNTLFVIAGDPMGHEFFRKTTKMSEWSPAITMKSYVRDSGEIIGGVKSFNRTLWDYEAAIPFKELGMKSPAEGSKIGFAFMRNYAETSKLGSGRWTSLHRHTPGKHFGNSNDFGQLVFGGNSPVYKMEQMSELTGGDVRLKGTVFNPVKNTVKVQPAVEVVLPARNNKVALDKSESLTVGKKAVSFDVKGKVYLRRSMDLVLTNKITANGRTLYENSYLFTTLPAFHCELIPLFLQDKLVITSNVKKISGLSKDFKVIASIKAKKDGKSLKNIKFEHEKDPKYLKSKVDISSFKPGEHTVSIELIDKGKVVAVQNHELNIPAKPEWFGNKLGISDKVPVPYTPLKSTADSVSVWGRTYKFGKSLFPEAITSQNGAVINGAMELHAVTDKGVIVWKNPKLVRRYTKDTEAVFDFTAQHPQLNLKGTVKVEYDGFMRIDFTLDPKSKTTLKNLSIRYKMADKNAFYARAYSYPHYGYAAYLKKDGTGGEIKQNIWRFSGNGWKWQDAFVYYLWTGGDDAGLTLMVESDCNFNTAKYVSITPAGDDAEVVFNIIDKATPVKVPRSYSIALQATPVKALPEPEKYHFGYYFPVKKHQEKHLKGFHAAACYSGLAAGCAYPGLTNLGKEWSKRFYNNYGFRIFADGAYSWVADNLPVHKIYGKELQNSSNFSMSYGGKNTVSYCRKGAFADYLCWIYKKRFEDGARGAYHDGVNPGFCDSEFHGCGYVDVDGKRGKTNNIFAIRETFKRLYTMHKELAPDFFTFVHNSPVTPIGGFADGCCEGESWSQDYSIMTTHHFRAGFACYNRMSAAFTLYPFVSYNWRYKDLKAVTKVDELIPICLAYNMYPAGSGMGGGNECIGYINMYPVWGIMDEYFTTSEIFRFWDKNNPVKVSTPDLKAVVYLKKGQNKALVLIANIDRKKVNGTFKINTAKLFGNNAKCEIREIIPAQYTYDKAKNDFYISSKKSFKNMPGKADSEFNAEFAGRGIRYFEVIKK